MSEAEIHAALRDFIHIEFDLAELEQRVERLAQKLRTRFDQIRHERPHDDCHYYSFDMPLYGAPARNRPFRSGTLTKAGGALTYLAVYCCVPLPLVEARWTRYQLDREKNEIGASERDLLDVSWLQTNPREAELAMRVALDIEACGWQILGPEITEKPAPKDWPPPIASLDYGGGDYFVRDYIIRGLRTY